MIELYRIILIWVKLKYKNFDHNKKCITQKENFNIQFIKPKIIIQVCNKM